jgi:hypothetical protein
MREIWNVHCKSDDEILLPAYAVAVVRRDYRESEMLVAFTAMLVLLLTILQPSPGLTFDACNGSIRASACINLKMEGIDDDYGTWGDCEDAGGAGRD